LNAAKGDLDALDAAIKAEAAKAGIALRQEQLFDSNRDEKKYALRFF
jgi:hypothetical protein